MSKKHNKLFCFSYAGGDATFYRNMIKQINSLDSDIDVIALEYPGHGLRRREELLTDMDALAEDMLNQMSSYMDGSDYSLMGYSMGSIVATKVLSKIIKRKMYDNPKSVFLAAHGPRAVETWEDIDEKVQEEIIKKWTISFGAIPETLAINKTFWRIYLPLYAADYRLLANYDVESLGLATNIEATIFYSENDTPTEIVKEWNDHYVGENSYYTFEGNHFFIKDNFKEIAGIIVDKINNAE